MFEALPELAGPASRSLYSIPGRPPDLARREPGCAFAPRCRYATDWCASHEPGLDGDHPGHSYACFFPLDSPTPGRAAGRPGGPAVPEPAASRASQPAAQAAGQAARPLLQVSGLTKTYPAGRSLPGRQARAVSAVAGVSFELSAGQTFGLVGESGCGKTSVARLLAGLERPDGGAIVFNGADLAALPPRQRRREPGIQLMFQDSFASLDPRMRVHSILAEPLAIQKTVRPRGRRRQVLRILDEVGLAAEAARRYPREFSGGQRQRLALARALIQRPALIVADEPVSALDVSVQAQILNLMRKLQRQYGLTYLFISHDLSVIRYMADTIGVMYQGQLVEVGPADDVCTAPAHPYTAGLISAIPAVDGGRQAGGPGPARPAASPPSASPPPATPPAGCSFRPRCPRAQQICAEQQPALAPHGAASQLAACHFPLSGPLPVAGAST